MADHGGLPSIQAGIHSGRLQRVYPNPALAEQWLAEAESHLTSASLPAIMALPGSAFHLVGMAARQVLRALLIQWGLRVKDPAEGVTLLATARELVPVEVYQQLREFAWIWQLYIDEEYGQLTDRQPGLADVQEALPAAQIMLATVRDLLAAQETPVENTPVRDVVKSFTRRKVSS